MDNIAASSSTISRACHCALATITRKQVVALSGLGLALFVMVHMSGNMLVFLGPQAYNEYSHALTSNHLIYLAELGLVGMFLAHAFYASFITWKNYHARDTGYAMRASGAKRTPWLHRTLFFQGILLLVFVILHLITFKYGTVYMADYGHGEIRDLFKLMTEVFKEPVYVAWYLVALLILCFHLSHGVSSTIQSFGIHHPRYQTLIHRGGVVYALVVFFGFISQPIYIFWFYKG
jgi:succinate dehydrogenase / fumarate reductase cytochrome b subunit